MPGIVILNLYKADIDELKCGNFSVTIFVDYILVAGNNVNTEKALKVENIM